MAGDVTVLGAERLQTLARVLRQAGDKELQKELYAGLNRATKPLRADAKQSAAATLPQRGGLAQRVAKSRLSTRRGRAGSVRIQAAGMQQLQRMDRGAVRHPVYGRGRWVTQRITPGWFTRPMQAGAPKVRRELSQVLDDMARRVVRRVS